MPRPTSLTPEVQKRIIEALRAGNTRRASAEYGGVAYNTFQEWIRRGEGRDDREDSSEDAVFATFATAVTRAEADCEVQNVAVLKKAAVGWDTGTTRTKTVKRQVLDSGGKPVAGQDGKPLVEEITETVTTVGHEFDWRAGLEWLKRRRKDEWSEKIVSEHTGPDGGPIQTQDVGAYQGMDRGELNRGIEAALKPPGSSQP